MKTGIIGVGSMGKNHARVNSEMGVLAGIADSNEAVARPLAERFGVEYFSDYRDMLASVDAITVATPTVTHFQIAMDAIQAGKHVLVEKPICPTLDESEKLVKAAEDAGIVLAVGQIERHNPVVKFARESIENGKFGDIVSISARRVSTFPGRISDVGVLLDLGIHDIDVIRYLAQSPVKTVYALGGKRQNEALKRLEELGFVERAGQRNTSHTRLTEAGWIEVDKLFGISRDKPLSPADFELPSAGMR